MDSRSEEPQSSVNSEDDIGAFMSREDSDEGGDKGAADTEVSQTLLEKFKTATRGTGATGRPTVAASEAPTTPVLKTQSSWANFNSGGRGDVMTALYATYSHNHSHGTSRTIVISVMRTTHT